MKTERRIIIKEDKSNTIFQDVLIKNPFTSKEKVKVLNEIYLPKEWITVNYDKIPMRTFDPGTMSMNQLVGQLTNAKQV